MEDYSKIKHLKDLNTSMFNERMNRAYDYGYEDGLARGTECGYKRGYENGKKSIEECAEKITYKDINDAYKNGYKRGIENTWKCEKIIVDGCKYPFEAVEQDKPKQDKDYHEEAWWQNLGYDIEQMADDWGCTIECIAERANQLWEEKGEQNDNIN